MAIITLILSLEQNDCRATNQNGRGRFVGAKEVSLKELAFHCERRGLCGDEGVSDPMRIGVVGC
ncbi:MAG: hypothetical protein EB101_09230 [Chitinophagia bacterium]|nr:hypothetical protein [Chitinophagia bacterium]